MGSEFNDRLSRRPAGSAKEALVDINTDTEPTEPSGGGVQLKPRRNRLSEPPVPSKEPQSESQPQPVSKPQRRRLTETTAVETKESAAPAPSQSGRPRLSVQLPTASAEPTNAPIRTTGSEEEVLPAVELATTVPAEPCAEPVETDQPLDPRRTRQNLPMAVVGGLLAAGVGALLWALVTTVTGIRIGWMAIVVGLLVGGVVRVLGRGRGRLFGGLGAGLTLFGCLLGNYLTNCMFIAQEVDLPMMSVLTHINPTAIPGLMIARFHPLDVLFYGLGVCAGYYFAFRRTAHP